MDHPLAPLRVITGLPDLTKSPFSAIVPALRAVLCLLPQERVELSNPSLLHYFHRIGPPAGQVGCGIPLRREKARKGLFCHRVLEVSGG